MRRIAAFRALFLMSAAAALAVALSVGCSSTALVTPAPTPTPILCSGNPCTVTIPASGGTLVLPPSGGFTGSSTVPAAVAGGGSLVTVGSQTGAPSGLPVLLSDTRRLESGNTPVWYFYFAPSATITWNTSPSFSITLPSTPVSGVSYFLAIFNSSQSSSWQLAQIGPATVSGNTLTFPATNNSVTLSAGQTYWFGLYYTATTPSPSPSPSPSSSPTPSPTPTSTATAGPTPSPTPTSTATAGPTPTPTPTATATASPTPSPSPSATQNPQAFGAFGGSSTTTTFTSSGATVTLTAYKGYSATATWGANNAMASFTVTTTDATNSGDIGNPFTAWPGPGTGFLYLDIINNGTQDVTFSATPSVTITSTNTTAYPGTNCNLIAYGSNGTTNLWQIISTSPVAPTGGTLSFPPYAPQGNTIDLQAGVHQYAGFEC